MNEWSEHTLEVNGVVLHYYHYLKGNSTRNPPVLFLHGFAESGLCWTPVVRALADDYDIYTYDARGHGRSREPLPKDSFTLEKLVGDAVSLIKHLALSEPPALIGHSMGGQVTAILARAHPNLVKAVILEDPMWLSFDAVPLTEEGLRGFEAMEASFSAMQHIPVSQIVAKGQTMQPGWSIDEYTPWAEAQKQINLEVFRNGALDTRGIWTAVVQDPQDLPDIEPPTLLLTGENKLGSYVSQDTAEKVLKTMRKAYRHHFDGVGHYIRRNKFDEYIAEVRSFLGLHLHRG